MSSPKISCVIPTYNRCETITQCIDSVLRQSSIPSEIIIVNDGSTDKTTSLLRTYQDEGKIILIHQKHQGVSVARNTGILHSTGTWVALLDSDDCWLPQKIEKQLEFIEKNPQCRLLQTEEIWIRNGQRIHPKKYHQKKFRQNFEEFLKRCLVSPSAVMIHKEVFEKIGLFDPQLPCCEDFDFWIRASLFYPIDVLDEKLVIKYGGHADQLSRTTKIQDIFRIQSMEKIFQNYKLTGTQEKKILEALLKKISIVLKGAEKRKNQEMLNLYEKKLSFYQNK